jgi:hypothetical protein
VIHCLQVVNGSANLSNNRLFHRYGTNLPVAFRVKLRSFQGKLCNVSAGGCYVETDALPNKGSRLQMAAFSGSEGNSVWLDLQVAWRRSDSSTEGDGGGFGGYWVYACSRVSESHLRDFLESVLGITKCAIRPVPPPTGGEVVHTYRFPEVYAELIEAEFPWLVAQQVDTADMVGPGDHVPEEPLVASMALEAVPVDESDEGDAPPAPHEPDSEPAAVVKEPLEPAGGRWQFLTRKLSDWRARAESASAPVEMPDFELDADDFVVQYKVDRKTVTSPLKKVATTSMVFEVTENVPELWSRLELFLPLKANRRGSNIEMQGTVTRIKNVPDLETSKVHIRINSVHCKGHVGAYGRYIEQFNRIVRAR